MRNDLPKRKRLRLKNYDYSTPGAYFITICTHNKQCTLSHITGTIQESPESPTHTVGAIHKSTKISTQTVGAIHESSETPAHTVGAIHESSESPAHIVGAIHESSEIPTHTVGAIHESPKSPKSPKSPETKLTEYGKIIDNIINHIPEHCKATIDKYVIMPNHIHIILTIGCDPEVKQNEAFLSLSTVIGQYKSAVSRKIHLINPKITVWQKSFHDRIIRNEAEYLKLWKYIDENTIPFMFD